MAREELMIKPRREVAGEVVEELELVVPAVVVTCDVAGELGRVVPAGVVAREGAAEEPGLVAPARTTALMSPPWAPMPGTSIGMSPTIARTWANSSGYVSQKTSEL